MENTRTICLNMIVKNEEHCIEKSLNSIKHLIDYWIISDTGSTDNTKEKIKEILKDIPGELHENEFVDFFKQVDKSKLAVQKSLDELEILKKSLMQKYFG